MSDHSQGPDWWQASDGKWYPPETHPSRSELPLPPAAPAPEVAVEKTGWFRGWKRWAIVGLGALIVIGLVSALLSDSADDDPRETRAVVADEDDGAGDPDDDEQSEDEGPDSAPEESPSTPTPVEIEGGTRDVPWAFGVVTSVTFDTFGDADGSVWNVTIGGPQDITAAVLEENDFNDPPSDGVVFVGFSVEMTLVEAGKVPLSPGFNFTWELLGGVTDAVYDVTTVGDGFGCGVIPDGFNDFSEVFVGGTLEGTVCVPLPTEDLGLDETQVALNFSGGDRVVFGE